jgi:hypothetical protein
MDNSFTRVAIATQMIVGSSSGQLDVGQIAAGTRVAPKLEFIGGYPYLSLIPEINEETMAQQQSGRTPDLKMDAAEVYREDVYTDRKVGTIRCLTPVKSDGAPDASRKAVYVGEAQILTPMGALPVTFEIEAASLADAVTQYAAAAKQAVERTVKEIQELRRQAASGIVIPQAGAGALPGLGGGKIQLP